MGKVIDLITLMDPDYGYITAASKIDNIHSDDIPQYALCCASWVALLADQCADSAVQYLLKDAIYHVGLFACIDSADRFVKDLLRSTEGEDVELSTSTLSSLWYKVLYSCTCRPDGDYLGDNAATYAAINILRYPKRLTLLHPAGDAYKKFASVVREVELLNRQCWRWPGPVVLDHVRLIMEDMFCCNRKYLDPKVIGEFSNGSTSDAGKHLLNKFDQLVKAGHVAFMPWDEHVLTACGYPKVTYWRTPQVVTTMAVPKDYAEPRIIAPESSWMNWNAGVMRKLLIKRLERSGAYEYITLEDQTTNQELAKLGSLRGDRYPDPWCTIDLSSASDRISRPLFFSVFPQKLSPGVRCCLSDSIIYQEASKKGVATRQIPTPMLATSGSPLTPILESAFFLSLGRLACDLAGAPYSYVRVYNDDIIVRRSVFQTLVEVLELFGLVVNDKKTFSAGPYRESCGAEYFNGIDVSGRYWPRTAISFAKEDMGDTVALLCQMQHRFFYEPHVRMLLEKVIRAFFPRMTSSSEGEDCDDLWSSWVTPRDSALAPHYRRITTYRQRPLKFIKSDVFGSEAYTRYLYYKFLLEGPAYADPLDRLLGVSTAAAHSAAGRVGVPCWRLVEPPFGKTW